MTETTRDLVALHRADGKFIYVSPSRERLLGFSQQETIGKPPTEFCHPDDRNIVARAFKKAARSGTPGQATYRVMAKDGRELWLEALISPIADDKGKVTRLQTTSREISERKQAEAALQESHDKLLVLSGKLMWAQDEEGKRISRELHDAFSQELAALANESRLLKRDLPPEARGAAKRIEGVALRIGKLATGIHLMSRRLHPAILDDLGLPAALRAECHAFSQLQGIQTDFRSSRLPKSVPGNVALCLYRVAHQSLQNIAKHSGARKVRVDLTFKKGEIRLTIEDSGHGFDLQDQKRKKRGLGLISMEERVRFVGGTLVIDSRLGRGTKVLARIPLTNKQ